MDIGQKIHSLMDSELIEMCREIYDWKYTSGVLRVGVLSRFATSENKAPRDLEPIILNEANARYNTIVKLLFCDNPTSYLQVRH